MFCIRIDLTKELRDYEMRLDAAEVLSDAEYDDDQEPDWVLELKEGEPRSSPMRLSEEEIALRESIGIKGDRKEQAGIKEQDTAKRAINKLFNLALLGKITESELRERLKPLAEQTGNSVYPLMFDYYQKADIMV